VNNKGFAASGVLYTILIIGLVSMVSLLYDLQNKKSVLDKLKIDVVEATNEACSDPGFVLNATAYATSSAKPSSSTENAIAVITTTTLGKVSLTKEAPTLPASGDVWIALSYFQNNYIIENNIKIPIAYVQQYISGAWAYKEAYIFHGTSWSALNDLSSLNSISNFTYTGASQTFTAPATGYYKLETWGAQGGNGYSYSGGNGGYSVGVYHLTIGEPLYVYVGGYGQSNCTAAVCAGGYNGGSSTAPHSSVYQGGGGGATHISTVNNLLKNLSANKTAILLVAAGGGGGAQNTDNSWFGYGGPGGGTNGINASYGGSAGNSIYPGLGATQTTGGLGPNCVAGSFGFGGIPTSYGAGGGGGYYGGGCGWGAGGGGGSGYIGGVITYGGITASTVAGNTSFSSPAGSVETGHVGNGHARFTLLSLG